MPVEPHEDSQQAAGIIHGPEADTCGPVRRLLSAAPFILKGEGWYVTDYPSEARKKAAKSESGAESKPAEAAAPSTGASEKSSTAPAADSPSASKGAAKPAESAKPKKPAKPAKPSD